MTTCDLCNYPTDQPTLAEYRCEGVSRFHSLCDDCLMEYADVLDWPEKGRGRFRPAFLLAS
jgi:hypothetical protein